MVTNTKMLSYTFIVLLQYFSLQFYNLWNYWNSQNQFFEVDVLTGNSVSTPKSASFTSFTVKTEKHWLVEGSQKCPLDGGI